MAVLDSAVQYYHTARNTIFLKFQDKYLYQSCKKLLFNPTFQTPIYSKLMACFFFFFLEFCFSVIFWLKVTVPYCNLTSNVNANLNKKHIYL